MRIIFLAIVLSSFLHAQSIKVQPFLKKFYRLGYWWPVHFSKMPPYTSEQKLISRLDQFEVEQPFVSQAFGYFQVYNNFPQLTVSLAANTTLKIKKNFSLQKVFKQEILIGVYQNRELFTTLLALNPVAKKAHYQVLLERLPHIWQALSAFNFLILTKEPTKASLLAIEKWVLAGGRIVVANPLLLENKIIQKMCLGHQKPFFLKKWKSFRYGLGEGVYLEQDPIYIWQQHTDIWKKIIPFLGKPLAIPPYSSEDATISEIFTPQHWNKHTKSILFAICLCHTILILWFYRRKKNFFIKSLVLTLVVALSIYGYLKSYVRVFHSVLTITKVKPNISTILKQKYHYIFSLGPQHGHYKFSSLPAPIQKGPVKIIQTKKNWIIYKPNFAKGMFSLWQTLDMENLLGSVDLQKKTGQIWFTNNTEIELKQALFSAPSGVIPIGNFAIGEKKIIPFTKPKIPFFLLDSLPPPWDKTLFKWLQLQIPQESLCAYGELPTFHLKTASYQHRQILWIASKD